MENESLAALTKEAFPKIRAIIKEGRIHGATASLAVWGIINLGIWLSLGEEDRQFLGNLPNPSGGIYWLIYGPLVLSMGMLFFAALGAAIRSAVAVFLDGVSLIAVGLWNITYDFIAMGVLAPYGYTIKNPGPIWVVLGICQIMWGTRQWVMFARLISWNIPMFDPKELRDLKKRLRSLGQIVENPQEGIVKGTITSKSFIGNSQTPYIGKLIDDIAIMVSVNLDDCFSIRREDVREASFDSNGILNVQAEGTERAISLTPLSVIAFKTWSGMPVRAKDIEVAAARKAFTMATLLPFLNSDDPELLASAVSALSSINDPSAGELACRFVDNQVPGIQAAAIRACITHKIPTLTSKCIDLLNHSDERVRIAAAQYLSTFPQSAALSALENALASEVRRDVKKHIKRSLRSVKKEVIDTLW